MKLNNGSPLPLYQFVTQEIEQKIRSGVYKRNGMIPTELELCALYRVSRTTIQKALKTLVQNQVLTRVKGHGTYVSGQKIPQKFITNLDNFNREMLNKGILPRTRVLQQQVVHSDEPIAQKLHLKKGDPALKLIRVRYTNDIPILYITTYIPFIKASFLYESDLENNSLYETLAAHGFFIHRAKRILEIRKSDRTLAKELSIPINEPLFYFETIASTKEGEIMEFSQCYYRSDLNQFEISTTL